MLRASDIELEPAQESVLLPEPMCGPFFGRSATLPEVENPVAADPRFWSDFYEPLPMHSHDRRVFGGPVF